MKTRFLLTASIAVTLGIFTAAAAPSASFGGETSPEVWKGVLDTGAGTLRLELHVTKAEDDSLSAVMISVDQGSARIPVDSITIGNGEMTLSINRIGGAYKGQLNESGTVAEGTWSQGGTTLALRLSKAETKSGQAEESEQPDEPDVWKGALDTGSSILRLELHVTKAEDDSLSAVMISVDQGNARIPVDSITIGNGEMILSLNRIGGAYKGQLNESGTVAEGTWSQGSASFPLKLTKSEPSPSNDQEPEEEESFRAAWVGTLDSGPLKATMQFRIMETTSGKTPAYFDSITEGLTGFEANWSIRGDALKFEVPRIGATYEGTLNPTKDISEGQFKQGGREYDLTLRKQNEVVKNTNLWENRPQRPLAPFPYSADEATFENKIDKVTLAATLTIPKAPGTHPAVILISGSGPQDRDESLMEHKPFLVLADYLSRRGIAVLRYDDRGVGKSTGNFGGATSEDFARDAEAALDFLKNHERIDATRIGFVGHSEGGLVAPIVATRRDDVAFIVLMAGPGVDGETILYSQSAAIAKASGADEKVIRIQELLQRAAFGVLRQTQSDNDASPAIQQALDDVTRSLSGEDRKVATGISRAMSSQIARFRDPWFRFFLTYDPRPNLAKVSCPVLAINGQKDLQVLPDLNLPAIEKALRQGKNQDIEVVALEGLNHLFQESETGSITEYARIQETINPRALKMIGDWIVERAKVRN